MKDLGHHVDRLIETEFVPSTRATAAVQPLANGVSPVRSLEGLNSSVEVPPASAGFWRQMRAFAGPAFLVSIGYMDPGNWGTDQAGAPIATACSGLCSLSHGHHHERFRGWES